MKEEELKELSDQLMTPHGEKGIEIAKMMDETNKGMIHNAIDNLPLKGNEKLLEIGHGNAGHLSYLFGKFRDLSYEGIDISALMKKEAERLNSSLIKDFSIVFTHYDGEKLPYERSSFDAVLTVNTIYFFKDPILFLKEVERIMRPGAYFTLTFADADFMKQLPFTKFNFILYDIERITNLLNETNLKIEKKDIQKESIQTKTGEMVERDFVTILLKKVV